MIKNLVMGSSIRILKKIKIMKKGTGKLLVAGLFALMIFSCKEKKSPQPERLDTPHEVIKSNPVVVNQPNPYAPVDVSPMDMSYFPENYPQLKMAGHEKNGPVMRVIYSRPHLQGRTLFHDLLKHDVPWRLGANEATELTVYKPVFINNKKLEPGRYTLYCIPHQSEWTIAVNKNLDVWGLKIDSSLDVTLVTIPVSYDNPRLEYFTMVFEKSGEGANLIIGWSDLIVKVPFRIS
ncbi:MAG: DUF2911 domain-containing protein [Niabella sp.]